MILLSAGALVAQGIKVGDDGLYYSDDGKLYTGEFREHYPDRQIKTTMNITNGQIDGLVKIYFPNGVQNEIRSYKEGVMHGQWITWNEQGSKVAEANYENGAKDGKWYVWNEEGVLLYDMTYTNGQRAGTWKMYNQTGQLISEKEFD